MSLSALRTALYHGEGVADALATAIHPDAVIHLCHPFETMDRAGYANALAQLAAAFPDLEQRDTIRCEGQADGHWIGYCGHFTGTFTQPFLGIPPTRQAATLRYHEFYRIEAGQAVEMQAIWDIPELILQAGVWPMGPSLGRVFHVPAPATQDGLGPHDPSRSEAAKTLVLDMLTHLGKHADGGPEAMRLDAFWHPNMRWYGPAGIGTCYGIRGFRKHHQIPFLNAMPDRHGAEKAIFWAEGAYVATTGWPNMHMTLTGDGWLGIAPSGKAITMRSLDFWRCEGGLIRENWVLVDLLNVWHQLGVDVLARTRELT